MKDGGWSAPQHEPALERAWHLSILIAPTLQAWCVHALDNGTVTAVHWSSDGSALDSNALPTHPHTVSFVTLPEWSTLVPEGALEPGTEAQHLGLVHGGLPTGALRDERLASLGATCIYVHDDEAERAVLDRYPNARPVPMQALMVRSALSRGSEGAVALLHRGQDRLDVAIADRGRVLLSNTYPARSSQDLLYYALLAADGCGLQAADVKVQHGGTHLTAHERDLLKRYFTQEAPAMERWSGLPADSKVEPYRWTALLEQFACVS